MPALEGSLNCCRQHWAGHAFLSESFLFHRPPLASDSERELLNSRNRQLYRLYEFATRNPRTSINSRQNTTAAKLSCEAVFPEKRTKVGANTAQPDELRISRCNERFVLQGVHLSAIRSNGIRSSPRTTGLCLTK